MAQNKWWRTTYVDHRGNTEATEFSTKEENNIFAEGVALMGVKNICKEFYNPTIREWYRYHNNKPE